MEDEKDEVHVSVCMYVCMYVCVFACSASWRRAHPVSPFVSYPWMALEDVCECLDSSSNNKMARVKQYKPPTAMNQRI